MKKHGQSKSHLYNVWRHMIYRCEKPSLANYKYYGERGIRVCDEWHYFDTFQAWAAANGYKRGLSIDRIDNDGNYEPSNCRWVDSKTQGRNKRYRQGASGICGVVPFRDRCMARLYRGGKQIYIGLFPTAEAASVAVESARRLMQLFSETESVNDYKAVGVTTLPKAEVSGYDPYNKNPVHVILEVRHR